MGDAVKPRDLVEVLDAVIAEIPLETDWLAGFQDIRGSVAHAAPEMMNFWWNEAGEYLGRNCGDPAGMVWKERVEAIFSGRGWQETPSPAHADSTSGEQASEGREVAVSPVGALEGNSAQSSPLEDRLASEVRDALEWRDGPDFILPPPGFKGTADKFWKPQKSPTGETLRGWITAAESDKEHLESLGVIVGPRAQASDYLDCIVSPDAMARLDPFWGRYIWGLQPDPNVVTPCCDCGGQSEIILLLPDRPQKCINCLLIAAMKRPCSICGQHITEAITRALDEQGKPNTIGVCAQCFMKAVAAQRN